MGFMVRQLLVVGTTALTPLAGQRGGWYAVRGATPFADVGGVATDTSRCGGTVYAMVSKTIAREGLWVRVPPPAPTFAANVRATTWRRLSMGGLYHGGPARPHYHGSSG